MGQQVGSQYRNPGERERERGEELEEGRETKQERKSKLYTKVSERRA